MTENSNGGIPVDYDKFKAILKHYKDLFKVQRRLEAIGIDLTENPKYNPIYPCIDITTGFVDLIYGELGVELFDHYAYGGEVTLINIEDRKLTKREIYDILHQ